MNKRRMLLVLTLGVSALAISPPSSTPAVADRAVSPVDVLMVAGTATGDTGDQTVADAIRAGGHTVTIVDDDGVTAADANGHDVVLHRLDCRCMEDQADVHGDDRRRGERSGAPARRPRAHRNSNSARGSSGSFDVRSTSPIQRIRSLAHLDPLPTGRVEVFRSARRRSRGVCRLRAPVSPPPSRVAATAPCCSATTPAISSPTTSPAPGRRVGLFIHMSSDQLLDAAGARLTRAAVEWAADASGGRGLRESGAERVRWRRPLAAEHRTSSPRS